MIFFLLIFFFFLYYIIPFYIKKNIRKQFIKKLQSDSNHNMVCLTFDDGPHLTSTELILSVLKEHDIKATFFMIGKNVKKYPELVDKILADNHEIGDHSYFHTHAWITDPITTFVDLYLGKKTLDQFISSEKNIWIRPPYGKFNLATLLYIWFSKRRVALWNVDPHDYELSSSKELADKINQHLSSGKVILLHDKRGKNSSNIKVTIDGIQLVLRSAKHKGIKFVRLSEMISN